MRPRPASTTLLGSATSWHQLFLPPARSRLPFLAPLQALASPLSGVLGDRFDRGYVVAAGCALWGVMTAAIGLSQTLGQAMVFCAGAQWLCRCAAVPMRRLPLLPASDAAVECAAITASCLPACNAQGVFI